MRNYGLMLCLLWSFSAQADLEGNGDVLQIALPAAAYAITFIDDNPEARADFWASGVANWGSTFAIKRLVNKTRPNGGEHSFPSGHTSAAFHGAAMIQKQRGWTYGLPAYVLAAYTGYSRVETDHHDWQDVIAGAALGVASAHFVNRERVSWIGHLDGNSIGVTVFGAW
ncbi:MAG: phosphatase PAP2 family protein [Gammaproteobacteria bacterium]|nr:phosphatase PAP2 family protein [Gammaproteobacteria bacterium]